jgi:hypothetical protein
VVVVKGIHMNTPTLVYGCVQNYVSYTYHKIFLWKYLTILSTNHRIRIGPHSGTDRKMCVVQVLDWTGQQGKRSFQN